MLTKLLPFLTCFLVVSAHQAHSSEPVCPIPDVGVAAAAEDSTFDASQTRDILTVILVAARRDAYRADHDVGAIGEELTQLGAARTGLISHQSFALAVRLRQLDCAVWAKRDLDHPRLYAGIIAAARTALIGLGGEMPADGFSQPSASQWRLPPVPVRLVMVKPWTAEQHQRMARRWQIGGGLSIVGAVAMFVGAAVLTSQLVAYREPTYSAQTLGLKPFVDLGHGYVVAGDVVLWVGGAALTTLGAVFLHLAAKHQRLSHVEPVLSASPTGGYAGVKLHF